MSLIHDLRTAVENYETDECITEIVDFQMVPGQSVLNKGEYFTFKIMVRNMGCLDMAYLQVRADGTQYAKVGLTPFYMGTYAISIATHLNAWQTWTSPQFHGKAEKVTDGLKNIVTARVYRWNASLNHILNDHTGPGSKEGKLDKDILEQ